MVDPWCPVLAPAWCAPGLFLWSGNFVPPLILFSVSFKDRLGRFPKDGTPTATRSELRRVAESGSTASIGVAPDAQTGTKSVAPQTIAWSARRSRGGTSSGGAWISTMGGTAGTQKLDTAISAVAVGPDILDETLGMREDTNHDLSLRSALDEDFASTPQIIPVRGNLDSVRALMKGDCHTGCGCRQCGLTRSKFANPYKVAQFGREQAIALSARHLETEPQLKSSLWTLSGLRLVCHCGKRQACHADSLIAEYKEVFPTAYDRNEPGGTPHHPGSSTTWRGSEKNSSPTRVQVRMKVRQPEAKAGQV